MDKDWRQYCPYWDGQFSVVTHADALDCTAEAFCHIVYMLTRVRVSPRALAVDARLDILQNRTFAHVLTVVNKVGLVLYSDCPSPTNFTMQSYYAPLTASENKHFPVKASLLPPDLNVSPIWTQLQFGGNLAVPTEHCVALVYIDPVDINKDIYYDSEVGAPLKTIGQTTTMGAGPAQIMYKTSLSINIGNVMPRIVTQNLNGELRAVVKAASVAEWQALCAVLQIDPAAPIQEVVSLGSSNN